MASLTAEETSALITVAIQEVPSVIDALKSLFTKSNPTATTPSDADIINAFNQAFASSLAVDDQWLAVHPA
jgi:hypothetical protein